jgi:Bromodomain
MLRVYRQLVTIYDTIKTPMDLGTVKYDCQISSWLLYMTPIEFAEDINMTFKNALKFNNRRDAAYHMTEELLEIFKLEWSKTEADIALLFNNINMHLTFKNALEFNN